MATTIISSKEHPHFLDVDDKGVLKLRDNETISFNEPTDVEIGEDIYEIEEFLFAECADLKSLIIGSNLTKIGNSAFSNCTNLEQVKICRGSTKNKEMIIESSAFAGCKSLSNVSLSENVKTIGIRAFADCDNLKIKFLSYPNTIDKSTFDGCKSVEISLPYRCLESDVFKGFSKKIKIVENTDCFFYDHICYKVVSEENKTVSIADNSSLQSESLSLPSTIYYDNIKFTVTSIEDKAFYSNEFITHCELPKSLSSIGKAAFAYCSKLQSFRFPENEGENDKFLISSGVLYSKTEDNGLSMLSCPPLANGNHILILPENLKSIADYAFSGVSNLKRIYFKQPVEFSSNAFEDADLDNCYAFLGKELSENSSFLNDTPFKKTIQIGSQFEENGNVYSIESDYEFDHSTNNEAALVKWNQSDSSEVEIPETIEFVGVKYNVAKICETAFKSNAKITKLTITNAIKEIENNPFAVSTKLTEITVEKDNERFTAENGVLLEKTGKKERKLIAYPAGRNVKDYDIPENIVSIGENAFKNCSLTRIVIPKDDMITMDGKSGLPDKLDVVLPSVSAYKIYSKSSWNNYHLVLPDYEQEGIIYHLNVDKNRTAEIVGAKAGLKEVTIPVTVKFGDDEFKIVKICSDAFKKCTSLTKITCESENPVTLEKDVFYKKMTVYVPSGCYDIYNSATNWNVHTILDGEKPDMFIVGKIKYCKISDSEVSIHSVSGIASKDKLIIGSTVNYHNYEFKVVGIMKDAFKGINCTSVTIPASVTSIEDNPFKGCSANTKIDIDKNNTIYKQNDGLFTEKETLVFCQPSCTEITIPAIIKKIGLEAFASCPNLKTINLISEVPPSFNGEPGCEKQSSIKVVVPSGKLSVYKSSKWKVFNLREPEFVDNEGIQYRILSKNEVEIVYVPKPKKKNIVTIPVLAKRDDSTSFTIIRIASDAFAAFGSSLDALTCNCQNPPELDGNVFKNKGLVVTVPKGRYTAYKAQNSDWKIFTIHDGDIPKAITSEDSEYRVNSANTVALVKSNKKDSKGSVELNSRVQYHDYDFELVEIGDGAFSDCKGVSSVTLPASVTSLDGNPFRGTKIAVSLKGNTAFSVKNFCLVSKQGKLVHSWVNSNEFTLSAEIREIGDGAFSGCKFNELKITSDSMPSVSDTAQFSSIKKVVVKWKAYSSITNSSKWHGLLGKIELPQITVGNLVYRYLSLTTAECFECNASSGNVVLSAGFHEDNVNCTVVKIADKCFLNKKGLSSVVIPSTVTEIGTDAFSGCILNELKINSDTLPSISDTKQLSSTKKIVVNIKAYESITNSNKWYGLLEKIERPTITSGNSVFRYLSPSTVEYKEWTASSGVASLASSVTFDKKTYTVVKIADYCFLNKKGLNTVVIPSSINEIGDEAFSGCSLNVLEINSDKLPTISNKTQLNSIKKIVVNMIAYCSITSASKWYRLLEKIEGPKITISDSEYRCLSISTVECIQCNTSSGIVNIASSISKSNRNFTVVKIADNCFQNKKGLSTVVLPSTITEIGGNAFSGCTLDKLQITSDSMPRISNTTQLSSIKKIVVNLNAFRTISNSSPWHDLLWKIERPAVMNAIDLGLPSGTKWADCNIGATMPQSSGSYYAWGETEEKKEYTWKNYKWCDGSSNNITKYNNADKKTVLDPSDDVARVKWGGKWQIPTEEMFNELLEKCTKKWTTLNGVNGYQFIGPNGNSIFFPTTGSRVDLNLNNADIKGSYNLKSLYTDIYNCPTFYFGKDSISTRCYGGRHAGRPVRPVQVAFSRPGISQPTRPSSTNSTVVRRPSQTSSPSRNGGRRRR